MTAQTPTNASEWMPARTAPLDGTPIDVRFIDAIGEYPGFAIVWDLADRCWRNHSTGDKVQGVISRWREYVPGRAKRRARR